MRIAITAKAKHGDIMEAIEARGWTQEQGAEFCGISPGYFGSLLNLKKVPRQFSPRLEIKLYELTGKMPEELFPEWARQKDFLDMPKVGRRIIEITPQMLQGTGAIPRLLPSPEEILCREDLKKALDEILSTLSPREEKVIRMHIMDGEAFEKVGRTIGVSGARTQQIAVKALRKLRDPRRARFIQQFL